MIWKHQAKRLLAALTAPRHPGPRVAVLMLHSLQPGHPDAVAPVRFAAHLDRLLAEGWRFCAVGDLPARLAAAPAQRWACLTFDDGYRDHLEQAVPALRARGLTATFYVCPGFVTGQLDITQGFRHYRGLPALDLDGLLALAAAGMEIGAHTMSHSMLSTLPADQQAREMAQSQGWLCQHLGRPVRSFALPFGGPGSFDRHSLAAAAGLFDSCASTLLGSMAPGEILGGACPLLRRLPVTPWDSPADIAAKAAGRWDGLARWQRPQPFPLASLTTGPTDAVC